MKTIIHSFEYAGMWVEVLKNEQGEDVTPLKPIADLFGLQWPKQHKKVTAGEHFKRFLGVCIVPRYYAGAQKRDHLCILLSRVASYMMSLNPEQVRAQGNAEGADFLEKKLTEWADAVHEYELLGVAYNANHAKSQEALRKQRMTFVQMVSVKNKTENMKDRWAVSHIMKKMADEMGIPYQPDMLDICQEG